ncbi:unnamed protein product [Ixodes persulcatus]
MSFTLRFLDTIDGKVIIQETFIGFKTLCESTGKGLTKAIMSTLQECGIMIEDCRGQGYGNGANMKGKRKGVQARILEKNPRAFFVPCGCHSLSRGAGCSNIFYRICPALRHNPENLCFILCLCSSLEDPDRSRQGAYLEAAM